MIGDVTTILVRDFKIPALIGIYPREINNAQMIEVNVDMELVDAVVPHDRIENTVSYEGMVNAVRTQAAIHHNLVETLAETLAQYALSDLRIARVRVQLFKLDVFDEGKVGCDIIRTRSN